MSDQTLVSQTYFVESVSAWHSVLSDDDVVLFHLFEADWTVEVEVVA